MILTLAVCLAHAQESPLDPRVTETLAIRIDTAQRLMGYDIVAWLTSDAVMAEPEAASQLGRAWFVLQEDGTHVGVFGRYDAATDHFVHVRSYQLDPDTRATTRVEAAPPPEVSDPRARAIDTVWAKGPPAAMKKLMAVGVNPNQYVFVSPTGIDVWLVPSLAPDGRLVASTCAHYTLDAEGRRITSKEIERRKARVYVPGPEAVATLESIERVVPSVCELYWAYYYADDFKDLAVATPAMTVRFGQTEQGRVPMVFVNP